MECGDGQQNGPSLPLELLEDIVDYFDVHTAEGREVLKACSYTNLTLSRISQKRVFKEVVISAEVGFEEGELHFFEEDKSMGKILLLLVIESPHIAAFIKCLTIKLHARSLAKHPGRPSNSGLNTPRSASFPLHPLVSRMRELRRVVVIGTGSSDHFAWGNFGLEIRAAFRLFSQNVVELDLGPLHSIPTTVFEGFNSLKALHITSPKTVAYRMSKPEARLESLRLCGRVRPTGDEKHSFLNPTFSPFNFSYLKKVVISTCDLSQSRDFWMSCSETLESLHLQSLELSNRKRATSRFFYGEQNPIPVYQEVIPNLSSLRKLREIRTSVSVLGFRSREHYDTDVPYACAITDALPGVLGNPSTVRAIFDLAVIDVPQDLLDNIAWDGILGNLLSEDKAQSVAECLELRFQFFVNSSPKRIATSRLQQALCNSAYLQKQRARGLILCHI